MDFAETTLADLRDRIGRGEITARAAAESALDAADKLNETLNAFLEIDREAALKRADEIDARITAGETPALPVPIAIKDNICVKGLQTSRGSRILGSCRPPYNATAIECLLGAGGINVGKT